MSDRPYYDYVLRYPEGFHVGDVDVSNVVFYVGKGRVSPSWTTVQRMDHHEVEARRGCTCRKCDVIRSIWAKDQQVVKEKTFVTENEHEAFAREETDIKVTYAGPYLVNFQHNRPPKPQKEPETERQRKARYFVQQTINEILKKESARRTQ